MSMFMNNDVSVGKSVVFTPTTAYRPFKAPKAMELAQEHTIALYWDVHQVELNDDIKAFHTEDGLKTPNVSHESNKYMLEKILSLFTQMDLEVGAAYCQLLPHVQNNEYRNMWMTFSARESVHQRAYALIVEELGFPESTWGEFREYKEMHDKIEVISNIDDRDHSRPLDFAKTLAQILLGEGIALFGAFACMLNLRRSGLMMGTNIVNEWSLRDEEKHVEGNIMGLRDIMNALTPTELEELHEFIYEITRKYVEAEHAFIDMVFEMGPQEGMTKQDMKDYIMYLANYRLESVGLNPIYRVLENPLDWMDWMLSGRNHTNFFENRVTAYDHAGLVGEVDYSVYEGLLEQRLYG
ncbi:ribonucleoside diphosphate reductase small subuni t [Vibrio phage D148]